MWSSGPRFLNLFGELRSIMHAHPMITWMILVIASIPLISYQTWFLNLLAMINCIPQRLVFRVVCSADFWYLVSWTYPHHNTSDVVHSHLGSRSSSPSKGLIRSVCARNAMLLTQWLPQTTSTLPRFQLNRRCIFISSTSKFLQGFTPYVYGRGSNTGT